MFWHNEEYSMGLGKDIYLDGVVCLVDAVYGQRVGAFFCIFVMKGLIRSVLQQIEEDHASEGEGESVRYGTKLSGNRSQSHSGPTLRQVACSDVVLINKVDLASEAQISTLEGIVHGINPLATTHRTTQSNIDLGLGDEPERICVSYTTRFRSRDVPPP
jgi:G3E family GTPase